MPFRTLRATAMVLAMGGPLATLVACSAPSPAESPQSVAEVQAIVSAATGYGGAALGLGATPAQITVTIVNSPVAGRSAGERQTDAQRVVFAVANAIKDRPEFGEVHTVHVDYVTSQTDGGARKVVDGFDFRKDPQGVFQRHQT